MGTWKLIIDIEEELEEAEKELEEEESILGEIIFKTVTGAVEGVLKRLEIYMDFRDNGTVKIMVDAFGEKETEYSEWGIDSKGRLRISDNEHFKTDDNNYWMMDNGILVQFEEDGDKSESVYMVKID